MTYLNSSDRVRRQMAEISKVDRRQRHLVCWSPQLEEQDIGDLFHILETIDLVCLCGSWILGLCLFFGSVEAASNLNR